MRIGSSIDNELERVIIAARNAAEFADGKAHGRSRTIDLRRLAQALAAMDAAAAALIASLPSAAGTWGQGDADRRAPGA